MLESMIEVGERSRSEFSREDAKDAKDNVHVHQIRRILSVAFFHAEHYSLDTVICVNQKFDNLLIARLVFTSTQFFAAFAPPRENCFPTLDTSIRQHDRARRTIERVNFHAKARRTRRTTCAYTKSGAF